MRALADTIGERNVFRPQALQAAADYIEQTWRAQGYAVSSQTYDAYGERCANLEVSRLGLRRPGEILLIGAHYDTVRNCPGANDNASGVAAMLEISRYFAERSPSVTVRFVAFVNEEPPSFDTGQQGSMVYAKAARARGDDIRLMVSLETMGCYFDAPGSQRYPAAVPPLLPRSRQFPRAGVRPPLGPGDAPHGQDVPAPCRLPARARRHLPLDPGDRLERSSVLLAPGLPRAHGRPTPRSTGTTTTTRPRTRRTS